MSDYYKILEVNKDATINDIKKSYRNLCKKYHPDVSKEENSESKFREIQEAYEVLSDDNKRNQYDRYGQTGDRHQGHGFNMEDIFTQFGDIFGGGFNRQKVKRGRDLRIQLNITLEDVISGGRKMIKYHRQTSCNTCDGKGGTDVKNCSNCNGFGYKVISQQTPFGNIQQQIHCNNCNSSGKVVDNKCKSCKGSGTQPTEENIEVNLPKGAGNGMQFNMYGQGDFCADGQPGDLIILIQEIPHSKFKRDGGDLFCEEWITIPEAVLGTKIKVDTLTGNINLTIENGCESGKVFTIKGRGTPIINHHGQVIGNGDLHIKINVIIPKSITAEQRELYKKLK